MQKSYFFHTYDEKNNLITKYNYFLASDSKGFLWISSTEGLNRFDGLNFKSYLSNKADSTTLADGNVQSSFFEDAQSNLWFCTNEAIHRYNRQTDNFTRYWIFENGEKIEKEYYVFHLDTEGYLWFRNGSWNSNPNLYRVNTKTINGSILKAELVSPFSGYRSKIINKKDGGTTILTFPSNSSFGLDEYLISKTNPTPVLKGYFTGKEQDFSPIKFKIKSLITENENLIWLATDIGLVLFNKKEKKYEVFDTFKNEKILNLLSMTAWKDNFLIVSTRENGILFFDKLKKQFYEQIKNDQLKNIIQGLCSNVFEAIYMDDANNLWLSSSSNSCLNHINLDKIKFSNIQSVGPINKNFTKLIEDDMHYVWVSYSEMGIVVFNTKGENVKTFDKELFSDTKVRRFMKDNEGNIWILTDHQVLKSARGTYKIESILIDKESYLRSIRQVNDKMLISTNKGLFEIKNKKLTDFTEIPELYRKHIYERMFIDSSHNLYLACSGLKKLLVFNTKNYDVKNEIPVASEVEDILFDNDTLWISEYNGLSKVFRANDGSFQSELISNIPFSYNVLKDKMNQYWLCADGGLYNFDPLTKVFNKFTASDGLKGSIFTSLSKLSNGEIWLLTHGNINVFRPENIEPYIQKPNIQIIEIKVNDADFTEGGNPTEIQQLSLPYNRNTVALRFVAIEFADPKFNRLKFRLDNYDSNGSWTEVMNENGYIKYFKLPAGTYTMHIRAANADGVWMPESEEKTFIIHINPPWYLTWWAIFLWISIVVALAYGILQWRLSIQRKKAEIEQKILKTEMRALRAQMDPHFLHNAMNSINAFILKNDKFTASKYLTNFSHFVREILYFSKEEAISLEKEAELLRGYLDIQAMRFSQSFDYEVLIDEDLDEWDTQIPTMILQPFIENALLHGIQHKADGRGKVSVRFEKEDKDFMRCIVEDNGIGRFASAIKNSAERPKEHVSKALQITADRIEIFNLNHTKKAELFIEDLYNENQKGIGTKVIIRMPI